MRIKVRLFASYREIAGRSEDSIDLGEGAKVRDFLKVIMERYRWLADLRDPIAISVNDRYTTEDTALQEGDEVAILPPISGG